MSKYIDAEQFKRDNERLLHCDFPYLAEETLEELIDNAPAADIPRWIPVEDGLPEEEGQYLVSCNSDFAIEVARFYIDSEDEDDRWFGCDWNDPEDIVAWMPLPTPYKGGEEE